MTQPANPLQSPAVAKLMADPAFLASIEKATGTPLPSAPAWRHAVGDRSRNRGKSRARGSRCCRSRCRQLVLTVRRGRYDPAY